MSEKKHKLNRRIDLVLSQEKLTAKLLKLGHHVVKHPNDLAAEHNLELIKQYAQWTGGL